jgi:hypothetical protein
MNPHAGRGGGSGRFQKRLFRTWEIVRCLFAVLPLSGPASVRAAHGVGSKTSGRGCAVAAARAAAVLNWYA